MSENDIHEYSIEPELSSLVPANGTQVQQCWEPWTHGG